MHLQFFGTRQFLPTWFLNGFQLHVQALFFLPPCLSFPNRRRSPSSTRTTCSLFSFAPLPTTLITTTTWLLSRCSHTAVSSRHAFTKSANHEKCPKHEERE